MWQTKYASAVPKNLGLGLNFQPCREGYFLSGRPQSVEAPMFCFLIKLHFGLNSQFVHCTQLKAPIVFYKAIFNRNLYHVVSFQEALMGASLCDIINGPYCTCDTFTVVVMQSSCSHQAFVRNPSDILFKSVRLRIAFYTESLCAIFIQSINNNVLIITSKSCTSINWLEIGSQKPD